MPESIHADAVDLLLQELLLDAGTQRLLDGRQVLARDRQQRRVFEGVAQHRGRSQHSHLVLLKPLEPQQDGVAYGLGQPEVGELPASPALLGLKDVAPVEGLFQ
jgi:hypothetical protein